MSKVRLTNGGEIELDGDLLAVLETLYREVTLKNQLQVSFEEMMQEIQSIVDQMGEEERRSYLVESLFLNSVTYENERLDAYLRSLGSEGAAEGETDEGSEA